MLGPLQQAIVDMQRVSRPQPQVQLQHNGLGVLGVQQPGTSELRHSASVSPEKIWGGKGAIEVPQTFAAGGVGAPQLVGAIGTVTGSVAAQGDGQAAGGLALGAGEGAEGAEARLSLSGRGGAAAFVGGIATFVLTVALPGAGKTLPIPTQELIRLTAALTQVAYREKKLTGCNTATNTQGRDSNITQTDILAFKIHFHSNVTQNQQ